MRATLKNGTRDSHDKVDDAFSTLDLAVYDDYAVFLNAHFRAYASLARYPHGRATLGDALVELKNLIRADLRTLGALDDTAPLPPVADRLHPLGVGYVIGGSHFGKRVLQKRWSKSTDPRVLNAGRYLDTALPKQVWGAVLAELGADGMTRDSERAIVSSATATFDLFFKSFMAACASSA